jgi:hypothetical protein
MCWLIITAINDHIMRCRAAKFPDEHPECPEPCCPNESCCTTCNTLRWLRDNDDAYVTRLLSRYDKSLSSWQMADGSIDWAQIEGHWDDTGDACNRASCIEATEELARRLAAVGLPPEGR